MRNNKLILLVIIVLLLATSCYSYNTRIEVADDFILSSQKHPKGQLAENLHLKVTIFQTVRDSTLAFGYLEVGKERIGLHHGFIVNSRNRVDHGVYRLQCETQESSKENIDRFIYLKIQDGKIVSLDLIEGRTDKTTSRTDSEVGTYLML